MVATYPCRKKLTATYGVILLHSLSYKNQNAECFGYQKKKPTTLLFITDCQRKCQTVQVPTRLGFASPTIASNTPKYFCTLSVTNVSNV